MTTGAGLAGDRAARAILRFDAARLVLGADLPSARASNLVLEPGDFALIDAGDSTRCHAFADAASGLVAPAAGRIFFLGQDWAATGPDDANALRGRIGRLSSAGQWIDSLAMDENILIQQSHHTRRDAARLADDAARLARHFGLPGLPLDRPGACAHADLGRAALVRAFLGRPRLVILEHQAHLAEPEHLEPLVNAVRTVRDRGGAVLWLTLDPRAWVDVTLPVTRRLRIIGAEIQEGAARS
jgi:phospholipid/cholesterol/gamma-HCH transport system ATP-binding protein